MALYFKQRTSWLEVFKSGVDIKWVPPHTVGDLSSYLASVYFGKFDVVRQAPFVHIPHCFSNHLPQIEMAKDKTKVVNTAKAVKAAKVTSKVTEKALTKVKSAGVTKPSQTPKAKSKEVARKFVSVKKSGGKKKAPSPSSSESESDSDEDVESESEDENQATKISKNISTASKNLRPVETDSESASEESSDTEEEKPIKATNGINSKKFESKFESEPEESESEDEAESQASESEQEGPKTKISEKTNKANDVKVSRHISIDVSYR